METLIIDGKRINGKWELKDVIVKTTYQEGKDKPVLMPETQTDFVFHTKGGQTIRIQRDFLQPREDAPTELKKLAGLNETQKQSQPERKHVNKDCFLPWLAVYENGDTEVVAVKQTKSIETMKPQDNINDILMRLSGIGDAPDANDKLVKVFAKQKAELPKDTKQIDVFREIARLEYESAKKNPSACQWLSNKKAVAVNKAAVNNRTAYTKADIEQHAETLKKRYLRAIK